MKIQIEEKRSLHLVGKKTGFSFQESNPMEEIPALWDTLSPAEEKALARVSLSPSPAFYGISANISEDRFDYWIAVESDEQDLRQFAALEIPAATWAVFDIIGPMRPLPNALQDAMGFIFDEWLPKSKYQLVMTLPQIECYPMGDTESPTYESQIWIPIEEK